MKIAKGLSEVVNSLSIFYYLINNKKSYVEEGQTIQWPKDKTRKT